LSKFKRREAIEALSALAFTSADRIPSGIRTAVRITGSGNLLWGGLVIFLLNGCGGLAVIPAWPRPRGHAPGLRCSPTSGLTFDAISFAVLGGWCVITGIGSVCVVGSLCCVTDMLSAALYRHPGALPVPVPGRPVRWPGMARVCRAHVSPMLECRSAGY
jgi:hypothetical protein